MEMMKTEITPDVLERRLVEISKERDELLKELEQTRELNKIYNAGKDTGVQLNALIEGMMAGGLSREEAMRVVVVTANSVL